MSVFLTNPLLLTLTAVAVTVGVSARFVPLKILSTVLHIGGFLLVAANITYALLSGAELADVLVYVLIFILIGITAFLPRQKNSEQENDGVKSQADANSAVNTDNAMQDETEEEK